jgi:hypothetical protein
VVHTGCAIFGGISIEHRSDRLLPPWIFVDSLGLCMGARTMTAPTKAQIEALIECADDLEAYIKNCYEGILDYPHNQRKFGRDMVSVNKAREAIAALTAAAGVKEPWPDYHGPIGNAAAAGMEDGNDILLDKNGTFWDRRFPNELIDHTIERCALEADKYGCWGASARIRALKEGP